MTNALRKAINKRSQLEIKYLRKSMVENINKYFLKKNYYTKLYKKECKKFYSNLNVKSTSDHKLIEDIV